MTTTPEATNKTSKFDTAKRVARFVVRKSVAGTVVTLIHQNTETFSKSQKAQLYIGAFLVGDMVAGAAWDHSEKMIDETADAVRSLRQAFKDAKATDDVTNITEL